MKNYNMIITEKLQKYQHYIEQANFSCFPLRKALSKQTKKLADVLKSLNPSTKIDKLKQMESIFPK